METIIPKLHASAPEPLDFGPSLEIRAFLLQRERGNLLIYRAATLEQDVEAVGDLGGVSRQYLNHHHEASPACDWVARTFDAPLHVHEADARAVSEVCNVDETFSERHKLDEDFEIIPIPGHTSGATAFLWDTGQHRALFTGDTVFFIRGRWRAAVLDGVSDRERYMQSLELIRGLDFDFVVPGIAPAGEPYYEPVDKSEAERRIDEILERLSGRIMEPEIVHEPDE
jgi:glyoxylase-like metal-dependent hydrolase (beta-lactamase superfamily II)